MRWRRSKRQSVGARSCPAALPHCKRPASYAPPPTPPTHLAVLGDGAATRQRGGGWGGGRGVGGGGRRGRRGRRGLVAAAAAAAGGVAAPSHSGLPTLARGLLCGAGEAAWGGAVLASGAACRESGEWRVRRAAQ